MGKDTENKANALSVEEQLKAAQEELAARTAENEKLKSENEQHVKLQEELVAKLEEKSAEADAGKPVAKIGGKKYAVMAGARVNGKVYTAKDLASKGNLEVAERLLNSGSEILKLIS